MKKKILKKIIKIFAVLLIVFFILAGIRRYIRSKYTAVFPKIAPVVEAVYALGTVKSDSIYNLRIGVTSEISRIYVKEGERVYPTNRLILTDSYLFLKSPLNGTVTKIFVNKNEMVTPGQPILTIVDLSKNYIEASLDQESIILTNKNQKVTVSFENLRENNFNGSIDKIYPSEDKFIIRINVEKFTPNIFPGMTCDVMIEIKKRGDVLQIPLAAINDGRVMILRNKKRMKVKVDIGAINKEWGEVLNREILPTDLVVVKKERLR